jgi:hypothetical protein
LLGARDRKLKPFTVTKFKTRKNKKPEKSVVPRIVQTPLFVAAVLSTELGAPLGRDEEGGPPTKTKVSN